MKVETFWRIILNVIIIYVLISRFDSARSMELYDDYLFRYQWLIFHVPDQWNSIDLVIENSKCDAPSPLSMNWAELHFWLPGHLSSGFQGEKNDFQKIISYHSKIDTFWRITRLNLYFQAIRQNQLLWISTFPRMPHSFPGRENRIQNTKKVQKIFNNFFWLSELKLTKLIRVFVLYFQTTMMKFFEDCGCFLVPNHWRSIISYVHF